MSVTLPKSTVLTSSEERRRKRREEILIGPLPDDFLRFDVDQVDSQVNHQIDADEQTAIALQQQQYYTQFNGQPLHNIKGRLDVTVIEARLVKNYGVTRMDPYLRLRIGHQIYETKTAYNGAKNPRWNKVFHCFLPNGVDSFHIEIYDECAFSVDGKVAWTTYAIPQRVFNSETVEDCVLLSGKQGELKEGTVDIVLSFTPLPVSSAIYTAPNTAFVAPAPVVITQGSDIPTVHIQAGQPPLPPNPVIIQQQQQQQQQQQHQQLQLQPIVISEEDLNQVKEMFPTVDKEVIEAIMESNRGNKVRTINALLQMTSETQ